AVAEGGQLGGGVLRVLAGEVWIGRTRIALAGRTVAGGAGRDAARDIAAAVQPLAHFVELLAAVRAAGDDALVSHTVQRRLAGVVGAEVAHVLLAQRCGEAEHDRVLPLGALEQLQHARRVALVLSGELRVLRIGGVAVHAVAGRADGGLRRATLGITGLRRTGIRAQHHGGGRRLLGNRRYLRRRLGECRRRQQRQGH